MKEFLSQIGTALQGFQDDPDKRMALLQAGVGMLQPPQMGQSGLGVIGNSILNATQGYQATKANQAKTAREQAFMDAFNPAKLENLQSETELNKAKATNQGKSSTAKATDKVRLAEALVATDPTITTVEQALVKIHNDGLDDKMIGAILPNMSFMYGDQALPEMQSVLDMARKLRSGETITGDETVVPQEEEPEEGLLSKAVSGIKGLFGDDEEETSAQSKGTKPSKEELSEAKTYLKSWLVSQGINDRDPTDQEAEAYLRQIAATQK